MNQLLTGICIYPDLIDIEQFTSASYLPEEWEPYKLTNGNIIDIGQPHKKIIFDFDGGQDEWSGFIKGFLYPDGRYVGRLHYVAEARLEPDVLNGWYSLHPDGIELKGTWYSGSQKLGFFILLDGKKQPMAQIKEKPVRKASQKKTSKKAKPVLVQQTYPEVLDAVLFERIDKRASKLETKDSRGKYSIYEHITRLKPEPKTEHDLLIAMSIAYSWMPTMLDLYVNDAKEVKAMLPIVRKLGQIKTLEDFDKNVIKIQEWISYLTERINRSVVGASKTLHIFFPDTIPIIDSRVLKGWNNVFESRYRKYPAIKLPLNVSQNQERMIKVYLNYWRLLLCWKKNTGRKSIRQLEKPLYWIGKQ